MEGYGIPASALKAQDQRNQMDIHEGHSEADLDHPGVFFAGLRIAQKLVQWLIHMFKTTEQELDEAGVDLGRM
jgi:hypothetical protein